MQIALCILHYAFSIISSQGPPHSDFFRHGLKIEDTAPAIPLTHTHTHIDDDDFLSDSDFDSDTDSYYVII